MSLKNRINEEMKQAMRTKDSATLSLVRMLLAAIKQVEVDERVEVDDARIIDIVGKMRKQRQESERIYREANRLDLAEKEAFDAALLQTYLPAQMNDTAIAQAVQAAIDEVGAQGMAQMGAVMALLKPRLNGQADMAVVSKTVKGMLSPQ